MSAPEDLSPFDPPGGLPDPPPGLVGSVLATVRRRRIRRRLLTAAPLVVGAVVAALVIPGAAADRGTSRLHVASPTPHPTPSAVSSADPSRPSASEPGSGSLSAPPGSTDDHAWSAPSGPVTTGLGDVDGDGRPDRIIVNAQTASVTVHTAAGTAANVQLKFGGGRLEGVSDLARTGRRLILLTSSASGCCGYTPDRAQVTVVGLVAGHLVRFAASDGSDPLSYNDGQGQEVEGFACAGHGIVTETRSAPYLAAAMTDSWTTTTYRLVGSTFTTISSRHDSGSPAQLGALTSNVGCSGITAISRAD